MHGWLKAESVFLTFRVCY